MKKPIRKWVVNTFFVLALITLVSSSAMVYRQLKRFFLSDQWASHSYIVIAANHTLLFTVMNATKLEHDYFYLGNPALLQSAEEAVKNIPLIFTNIKTLTADNREQQVLLQKLYPLLQNQVNALQQYLSLYQQKKHADVQRLIHSPEQLKMLDEIKEIITALNRNEEALLHPRIRGTADFIQNANLAIFIYTTLCNLLIVIGFYLIYTNNKKTLQEQAETNQILENQNKKLIAANQLKNDFLENMSHEFLTPLNGIIGFTEILTDEKAGPVSLVQKEYLSTILSSSKRLSRLIHNILDLQQLEENQIILHPAPVKLSQLLQESCQYFSNILTTKSIQIDTQIDSSVRYILIDPKKLKRIIRHYLSNAIKFTGKNGKIIIRINPIENHYLRIEVEDNGIGIREEEIDKLFIAFQQIDSSFKKKYQGAGLGLALTRRLCEAQGGEAGVTSVHGKGSVFFATVKYEPID